MRFSDKFQLYSCLFAAPGPVYGLGLVDVLGGLWSAVLQIPKSESGDCVGSAGEVSALNM